METDEVIDVGISIIILAIFLTLMMPHMIKARYDYGGFDTLIEKTAIKTEQSLQPIQKYYTKNDIILMLSVTDEYEPNPRRFNIDGLTVIIDSSFLQNRITTLVSVNTKLKNYNQTDQFKLTVKPGTDESEEWVFTKM